MKTASERHKTVEYRCPDCYRWSEWTDGLEGDEDAEDEFWCQTCGSQTPVDDMESRYANEQKED